MDFGLALGVPGKAPIFYAAKVSFRVPRSQILTCFVYRITSAVSFRGENLLKPLPDGLL